MNSFKRFTMMASLLTGLLITLLVSYGSSATPAVSASGPIDPLQITHNYFDQNRAEYGWTDADLSDYLVTDMYQSSETGVTHVYLRQRVNGIEVWNGTANANVMPDGSMLLAFSSFAANVDRSLYDGQPALTAAEALNAAAQELNWPITEYFVAEQNFGGVNQAQVLSTGGISASPIPAKLVYTNDKQGQLILAWEAIVEMKYSSDWWQMTVDATTGKVLEQLNWTVSHNPADIALSDARIPFTASNTNGSTVALTNSNNVGGGDGSSYRVYARPIESPIHSTPASPADGRTLEAEPADTTASPFGWHDTNGAAGPEFTTTQGNNVHAYTDTNADNTPDAGSSPDGGAGLDFDFPLDLTQAPNTYVPASVTNLFYWNNVTHDLLYRHGFNEASGNFQVNNYGNGGAGNDDVRAEGQDGAGTNNANFSTPADGSRPRMQMFNWTTTTPGRDGDFDAGIIAHEYGHGWSNRLTGGPANVGCLGNSEQMGEGWSDFLSVVFTARAGDTALTTRGVGTYALGQPTTGPGIRPAPYTTDMGVNNFTYANLGSVAIPHGVGFVWNTMLWEVYWNLVEEHGFNPNLYQGHATGGNNLALRLVSDGLKLQPCSPGFVDGRDAILAADVALTGGANACLIWEGFAKRGLGFSASQGASSSTNDGTPAFDLPDTCLGLTALPTSQDVCQGSTANYTISGGSAFTGNVTLTQTGNPAPSTVSFTPNPFVAPGSSAMAVGNTATVPVGNYTIAVTGNDGTVTDTVDVDLNVFAGAPGTVTLTAPADGATGVGLAPTLTWTADANATDYYVEVATDMAFSNIVFTDTVAATSTTLSGLSTLTTYYWRVTPNNICGAGPSSAIFSFTTADGSLLCNVGAVDFEAGLPSDWLVTNDSPNANAIVWGTTADSPATCGIANSTTGSGVAACADSDFPGSANSPAYDTSLVTNPFSTLPLSTVTLNVAGYYRDLGAGNDLFRVEVWDGSSWVTELSWDENHQTPGSGDITLDLSDYAGNSNTQVRFRYSGNGWDWYAQVDDVELTCVGGGTDLGYLTGTVTDADTSNPISGADITVDDGANTYNLATDGSGVYTSSLPIGTYTITASTTGYFSETVSGITVVTNTTTVQDFDLGPAFVEIAVTPTEMEATVSVDGTADQTLTIWNMGTLDLDWEIAEDAGFALAGQVISAIDHTGTAGASAAAEFVGTVAESSAVAPAGKVEIFAPTDVLYDNGPLVNLPSGGAGGADASTLQTALGLDTYGFAHASTTAFSVADDFVIPNGEAWVLDSVTFYAYQTGSTTTSTITGYNYNLYDGPPGSGGTIIFSGNTLLNTTWSGIYRSIDTNAIATNRPIMATTVDFGGLTLDAGTYWLEWESSGSLASGPWVPPITLSGVVTTGNGLQFDGVTWESLIDAGNPPGSLNAPQGLPFIIEGSLASCNTDVPWLSVNPISGTVAAGGSEDVTVTYDATGYAAGVYTGTLCVNSNDPVTPQITVPVTMTVSAAGVDVGPDAALSGAPGETVTYTVDITNTGGITDTYDLSIAGNSWTTNYPASITLMAGEMGSFDVTVEIPAGAWAGDWDAVTVMATSQADGAISDWAELTTTAEAVYGFDWSADTTGHEGAAGETVTYTISLTNTGNTTDTFTISLAGHSWTTTSSHNSMMLAPGESADFTVSVTIDAGAAHPDTDTTTLTVTSAGDGSVTDNVALTTSVEEPVVPANPVIYLPMIMKP